MRTPADRPYCRVADQVPARNLPLLTEPSSTDRPRRSAFEGPVGGPLAVLQEADGDPGLAVRALDSGERAHAGVQRTAGRRPSDRVEHVRRPSASPHHISVRERVRDAGSPRSLIVKTSSVTRNVVASSSATRPSMSATGTPGRPNSKDTSRGRLRSCATLVTGLPTRSSSRSCDRPERGATSDTSAPTSFSSRRPAFDASGERSATEPSRARSPGSSARPAGPTGDGRACDPELGEPSQGAYWREVEGVTGRITCAVSDVK